MPVYPIVHYPDERLKTVCEPMVPGKEALQLAEDLLDTMNTLPGVGIAAPQIGVLKRLVLVDASRNPRHPPGRGLMLLMNPEITRSEGRQVFKEGCLSIPQYLANIERAQSISVHAWTPEGQELHFDSEGFEAVVLQHEIDHLNGILFLDRIRDTRTDLFRRKMR